MAAFQALVVAWARPVDPAVRVRLDRVPPPARAVLVRDVLVREVLVRDVPPVREAPPVRVLRVRVVREARFDCEVPPAPAAAGSAIRSDTVVPSVLAAAAARSAEGRRGSRRKVRRAIMVPRPIAAATGQSRMPAIAARPRPP
jgi:hypothetical protein